MKDKSKKKTIGIVYFTRVSKETKQTEQDLAYAMLKQGFYDLFQVEFDAAKIQRTSYGKPYYTEGAYHFNISHCREAVAVAVSVYPVGIDVESMRTVKCHTVRKCCSPREQQYVAMEEEYRDELSESERARFLQLWTLKESYVKMTGEGIRIPLHTISFDVEAFQPMDKYLLGAREDTSKSCSSLYLPQDLYLACSLEYAGKMENTSIIYREVGWGLGC